MLSTWRYLVNPFNIFGTLIASVRNQSRAKDIKSLHFLNYPKVNAKRIKASDPSKIRLRLSNVKIIDQGVINSNLKRMNSAGAIKSAISGDEETSYTVEFEIDKNLTLGEFNYGDLLALAGDSLNVYTRSKERKKKRQQVNEPEILKSLASTIQTFYQFSGDAPMLPVNNALPRRITITPGAGAPWLHHKSYYDSLAELSSAKQQPELLNRFNEALNTDLTLRVLDLAYCKQELETEAAQREANLIRIDERKSIIRIGLAVLAVVVAILVMAAMTIGLNVLSGIAAISGIFSMISFAVNKIFSFSFGFVIPSIIISDSPIISKVISFASSLINSAVTSLAGFPALVVAVGMGFIGVILTRVYRAFKVERLEGCGDLLDDTNRQLRVAKEELAFFKAGTQQDRKLDAGNYFGATNSLASSVVATLNKNHPKTLISATLAKVLASKNVKVLNLADSRLSQDDLLEVFKALSGHALTTINLKGNEAFTAALLQPEQHREWWVQMTKLLQQQPNLKRIYFDTPKAPKSSLWGKIKSAFSTTRAAPLDPEFESQLLSSLNPSQLEIVKPFFINLAINRVLAGESLNGETELKLFNDVISLSYQDEIVASKLKYNFTLTEPLDASYIARAGVFDDDGNAVYYKYEDASGLYDKEQGATEVTRIIARNKIFTNLLQPNHELASAALQEVLTSNMVQVGELTNFINSLASDEEANLKERLKAILSAAPKDLTVNQDKLSEVRQLTAFAGAIAVAENKSLDAAPIAAPILEATDLASVPVVDTVEDVQRILTERIAESTNFKERLDYKLAADFLIREADSKAAKEVYMAAKQAISEGTKFTFDPSWLQSSDRGWFLSELELIAGSSKPSLILDSFTDSAFLRWLNSYRDLEVGPGNILGSLFAANRDARVKRVLLSRVVKLQVNGIGSLLLEELGGMPQILNMFLSLLEYGYNNELLLNALNRTPFFLNDGKATLEFIESYKAFSKQHPRSNLEKLASHFTDGVMAEMFSDIFNKSNDLIKINSKICAQFAKLPVVVEDQEDKGKLIQALTLFQELVNERAPGKDIDTLKLFTTMQEVYDLAIKVLGSASVAQVMVDVLDGEEFKTSLDQFEQCFALFFQNSPNVLARIATIEATYRPKHNKAYHQMLKTYLAQRDFDELYDASIGSARPCNYASMLKYFKALTDPSDVEAVLERINANSLGFKLNAVVSSIVDAVNGEAKEAGMDGFITLISSLETKSRIFLLQQYYRYKGLFTVLASGVDEASERAKQLSVLIEAYKELTVNDDKRSAEVKSLIASEIEARSLLSIDELSIRAAELSSAVQVNATANLIAHNSAPKSVRRPPLF